MQGDSGFLTHEAALQQRLDQNSELAERFPAVSVEGHLLHIFKKDGDWCVWLNTEDMEFTGLCIGVGETRDAAVCQAVAVCEAVEAELQKPDLATAIRHGTLKDADS